MLQFAFRKHLDLFCIRNTSNKWHIIPFDTFFLTNFLLLSTFHRCFSLVEDKDVVTILMALSAGSTLRNISMLFL